MTESVEGFTITPGVGTITDAKDNSYTLSAASAAQENGKAILNGGGTSQMAYHAHAVYGQDARSLGWYLWNGKNWISSPAPVTVTTLVSTVTVATISTQRVNVPFTVKGTFSFTGDDPVSSLQYIDDTGGGAKLANATVLAPDTYTFSFVHSGYAKAGTYTLTVGTAGGASAKSNAFQVMA